MDLKKELFHRKIKQEMEGEVCNAPETFLQSNNAVQIKFEDSTNANNEIEDRTDKMDETIDYVVESSQLEECKTIPVPKITNENLQLCHQVCRLCAESITNNEIYVFNGGDLERKINFALPINVNLHDGLSQYICQNCEINLNLVYNFISCVINADKTFRESSNMQELKVSEVTHVAVPNVSLSKEAQVNNRDENSDQRLCDDMEIIADENISKVINKHKRTAEEDDLEKLQKPKKLLQDTSKQSKQMQIDQPYKCQHCPQHFTSYFSFTNHIKESHNVTHFICPEIGCSETFKTAKSLHQHIGDNHNAPVICHKCGKIFSNQEYLRKHQQNMHFYKVCKHCGMVFKSDISFEEHTALHKNNNDCQCVYCFKDFKNRLKLQRHARICHSGFYTLLVDSKEDELA